MNKKERKEDLEQYSLCLLLDNGIEPEILSEESAHYRYKLWDMWLTTGKFWNRMTHQKGKGIDNLILLINGKGKLSNHRNKVKK